MFFVSAPAHAPLPWAAGQSIASLLGLAPVGAMVADQPAALAPVASRGRPVSVPSAPSAPASGSSGVAAGGAAGGLGLGGLAAVLAALMLVCAARFVRPLRLSLAVWRPMAFVSIQERPG
jgi:hypothetical protein